MKPEPRLLAPQAATPYPGGMLVSRAEMRFDFQGAKFRLPRDGALLAWVTDQFLYGEVTGIQCGHWLYAAPTLEAAAFFARQATEELAHVRVFLRLHALLGTQPGPAHPVVRWLSTGSMGRDFAEHVATEMAVGEGMVLAVFQALIDTVEEPAIVRLLEGAARQEERHVAFGEQQTRALVQKDASLAPVLLGMNLLSLLALPRLARHVQRRLGGDHEVLSQAEAFLRHVVSLTELRLQRMGLLQGSLSSLGIWRRGWLLARAQLHRQAARFRRPHRLTDSYLEDPEVQGR
ncbi:MAG: ferritin-like domain-containing protein [Myxococcaceae bacterium]